MPYQFDNKYKISFKTLYLMVGILGAILPFLDVWKCGWHFPPSISESYYLGAIVPFTCILFSMGVVFFCNTGFDDRDKWANRISGIAAIGVVSFPCDSPKRLFEFLPFPVMHYISAIVLFGTFAYMCLFVFTDVRSDVGYTRQKNMRNNIYRICGMIILFGMFYARFVNIFWGEVIDIYSFVAAYLIQGGFILKDM